MSGYSASVAVCGLWLVALLVGCTRTDPTPDAKAATLVKGRLVRDASLISLVGKSIISTTIAVGNSAEKALLTNPNSTTLLRPTDIGGYSRSEYTVIGMVERVSINQQLNSKVFKWTPTGRKIVMVAMFSELIKVAGDTISNPQAIVWLWTLPPGKMDTGEASFSQGYSPQYINGKFILDKPTTAKITEKPHVWAVWTWDDKAINIIAASRELPLQMTR
jgi:hypothetical protein